MTTDIYVLIVVLVPLALIALDITNCSFKFWDHIYRKLNRGLGRVHFNKEINDKTK